MAHSGAQEEYQVSTCRHGRARLQDNDRLQHREGSRIGGGFRAPGFAKHAIHFRELTNDAVAELKQLLRLADGDAGQRRGHVQDRAFVERRHGLRSQAAENRYGDDNRGQRRADDEPPPAQRPSDHRFINTDQPPADGMAVFGPHFANQHGIGNPAEPSRPEIEALDAGQQQAQGGIEGDREQRGHDHGQRLGISQRPEHPAFLGLQRQHRQEGDGDHQQRKESRSGYFLDCADHDSAAVARAPGLFPLARVSCESVRPPRWKRQPAR